MIDRFLSIVAPHHCCGCGKMGTLLCDNCKYDIISDVPTVCIVCRTASGVDGVCGRCRPSYSKAWNVGDRKDALQNLVGLYKFERTIAARDMIADLLDLRLPNLPADTVIIPVPTTRPHIRERGYDHIRLIAQRFAYLRGLRMDPVLLRQTTAVQHGAKAQQRIKQAKVAFTVDRTLKPDVPCVLIDDIMTTGATLRYAAKALRTAGATQIWVAVVARQTLD